MICLKERARERLLSGTETVIRSTPIVFLQRKDIDSPPPNNYKIKSSFDKLSPDSKVYSFGVSRDAFKKVYLENHPP